MATVDDAHLILKLYELRREPLMRTARSFMLSFDPASFEEILELQRDFGSEKNGFFRQVLSFWEMAAAFVLRGLIDPEFFLDCNGENIFLYARFTPFLEQYRQFFGFPLMPRTGELIARYPSMQERHTLIRRMMEERRQREAQPGS